MDQLKIRFYHHIIDKLSVELTDRFPVEMNDFAFLDPRHFQALDAEEKILRLAIRYSQLLDPAIAVSQWRLAHHFIKPDTSLLDIYMQLPSSYTELRLLYKILLTLPVTTASVERGFSKLALVKNKLRSTMGQDRLESLVSATVEKDILLSLKDSDLVTCFASKADRRLLLA
jgi:hypothetical protein